MLVVVLFALVLFPAFSETRVFDERFETPGYMETSSGIGADWAETIGGGATLDDAYARGSITGAPTNWGDYSLYISSNSTATYIMQNPWDSPLTTFYLRVELVVNTLTTGSSSYIVNGKNSGTQIIETFIYYSDPNLIIRNRFTENGATLTNVTIAYDTPVRLEYYYNATTGANEWRVDGVTKSSGSSSAAQITNLSVGMISAQNFVGGFDNIGIATDDWLGAEPEPGGGGAATIFYYYRGHQ